ncbi:hypothetical protein FPF71_16530 [Algibacter amylolyticus]|uniref:DUF4919 domain-containing protein n=1 Tax=Algibacter amylolyticus TaxID=1608400 RepID=A0A5M7AW32_9FLAO|nr:hypothetical protein [Algibacter amylolyticus]KAA5821482.1 hypothetical protein F2B50_16530 [Algibacter amylolyticus]MBB5268359.1 hypothetical protein [Algibacter amylolyticus]TSJ72994.1 hypothetical protein FPF71_16530 [Algibacter amylolyticus]
MKTIKTTLLLSLLLCFTTYICQAQKMFTVHQDNVKPSMIMEYEAVAKKLLEASKKHNVKTSWTAITTNELKYLYLTPINNFAALDERPFADMAKAMGDDFGKMFDEFDMCYDSHTDYNITLVEDLSYMEEGAPIIQEGENFRKFYYLYFTPANAAKIREGIEAVKALYIAKGSTEYYRIYRSGFGNPEQFYLVVVSAKDEIDSATKSKANDKVLGLDKWDAFSKVINNTSRVQEQSGEIRPDLSYAPKE